MMVESFWVSGMEAITVRMLPDESADVALCDLFVEGNLIGLRVKKTGVVVRTGCPASLRLT